VCDEQGYFTILGRIDDVINVSGHRLSTMELESVLVAHELVAEAAVVGFEHEIKGQGIAAYLVTFGDVVVGDDEKNDIKQHIVDAIGAFARPDKLFVVDALPKTRSGKIMRRLLRDIAVNKAVTGDISTLEDKTILQNLITKE